MEGFAQAMVKRQAKEQIAKRVTDRLLHRGEYGMTRLEDLEERVSKHIDQMESIGLDLSKIRVMFEKLRKSK